MSTTEIEILKKEIKQLSLLKEINILFSSTIEQEKLLPIVFNKIVNTFSAVAGSLWLIDENKNKLICKIAEGSKANDIIGVELDIGAGIVGWATQFKKSTIIKDAINDKRYNQNIDKKTGFKTKTMLTAPLFISDVSLGAIQIINKKDGSLFSNNDLKLLENIASYASAAIYNSKIFEQQKQKELYEKKLNDISKIFNSTLDATKLNDLIIEKASELCEAEAGSFWQADNNNKILICKAAVSPDGSKSILNSKMKFGSGIVGWAAKNNEPSVVLDTSKDKRFNKNVDKFSGFITKSMISMPVSSKNEVLGVIQIINKRSASGQFLNVDVDFLRNICAQAALSLKNTQLFETKKKIQELEAILNVSKEITSTLNLEHMLMTVANLSATIIPNKRTAVSILEKEKLEISAISSLTTINKNDPEIVDLNNIHFDVSKNKKTVYVKKLSLYEKKDDHNKKIADYIRRRRIKSIWIKPLFDQEGLVGVLSIESENENFISKDQLSTIEILTNQITVALRNAMLYKDVPLIGIMEKFVSKKNQVSNIPKWKLGLYSFISIIVFIALFIIPFPNRVSGECEVNCFKKRGIYASIDGILADLNVSEGDIIKTGQVIGHFSNIDQKLKKNELLNQKKILSQEIVKLRGESKITDYKSKELELEKTELELKKIDLEIKRSNIISPFNGIVLSNDLTLKKGEFTSRGTLIIECSDLKKIKLTTKILENDIGKIKKDQLVQFRVEAFQSKVFSSKVNLISVDRQLKEDNISGDDNVYFLVSSYVDNKNSLLKPGMTGITKITTGNKSIFMMIASSIINYIRFILWI